LAPELSLFFTLVQDQRAGRAYAGACRFHTAAHTLGAAVALYHFPVGAEENRVMRASGKTAPASNTVRVVE